MNLDAAQKLIERELMDQEEFEEYISNRGMRTFEGVRKFKSVGRAMRRSNMTGDGTIIPNKPFNNRANNCKRKGKHSRRDNEVKKQIYGQLCKQFRENVD